MEIKIPKLDEEECKTVRKRRSEEKFMGVISILLGICCINDKEPLFRGFGIILIVAGVIIILFYTIPVIGSICDYIRFNVLKKYRKPMLKFTKTEDDNENWMQDEKFGSFMSRGIIEPIIHTKENQVDSVTFDSELELKRDEKDVYREEDNEIIEQNLSGKEIYGGK